MSAVPRTSPRFAPMREGDLDEVVAIENAVYTHPWTRGNFRDSLAAGYECRIWRDACALLGYFVLATGAGEAHLLNLSVAAPFQRQGHGSTLLREALRCARASGASELFLEVRPTNTAAQALYARFGFVCAGERRGYYPAQFGRENALVYRVAL